MKEFLSHSMVFQFLAWSCILFISAVLSGVSAIELKDDVKTASFTILGFWVIYELALALIFAAFYFFLNA